MRQRKAKDLDRRLAQCRDFIIENPKPETWDNRFGEDCTASGENRKDSELYLEIGCGKGQFIIQKAAERPEAGFIAIEGQETVILRAAEKARAVAGKIPWPENVSGEEKLEKLNSPLENLVFTSCFLENMGDFFRENQLSGVYLNFSDPWPKARHAKRRLTYRKRLLDYAWAIRPGGFMEIKTDNEDLFEFTLEEIEACAGEGITQIEMTRDLHDPECRFESKHTTTEYEDRFSGKGKNINYVKIRVDK